jgi:hypothetical protein
MSRARSSAVGAFQEVDTVRRIASGAMLGPEQPVQLQLLELPQAMKALQGVVMELHVRLLTFSLHISLRDG